MAWILAEASKDWKQSDLDISGTTKALRNFEIVYLLDKGIFGALGTSPSISTWRVGQIPANKSLKNTKPQNINQFCGFFRA